METMQGCPPASECEAEAEVLVMALEWIRTLGMNRAIIETDSLMVQLAMAGKEGDHTEFGHIIVRGRALY
ncbi:hypothetical protein LINPERHAP1_LOCUS4262 [Linum perenne]